MPRATAPIRIASHADAKCDRHGKTLTQRQPNESFFSSNHIIFTEERQRAEGSYAEGILIFDRPDATGSKAPKFIYEKKKKDVFRDA